MKLILICGALIGLLISSEKDTTVKETAADPPEQPEEPEKVPAIKKAARGKNGRFIKKIPEQEERQNE